MTLACTALSGVSARRCVMNQTATPIATTTTVATTASAARCDLGAVAAVAWLAAMFFAPDAREAPAMLAAAGLFAGGANVVSPLCSRSARAAASRAAANSSAD